MKDNIPEKSSSPSITKKRIVEVAATLFAIAAVVGAVILIANTTNENSNLEVQGQTTSLRGVNSFKSLDLFEQSTTLLSFGSKFSLTEKKLFRIVTGIQKGDPKTMQRVMGLVLSYSFELLDSNGNKSVTKSEWEAFVKLVFPQDLSTYNNLFSQVNNNAEFNLNKWIQFVSNQAKDPKNLEKLKPKTDKQVIQTGLAKLVLNDDRNYPLTYSLVFQIFDENNDKTLTKVELKNVLIAFGIPEAEVTKDADTFFSFAQQNKLSEDGQSVKYATFSQFAVAMRKPLQEKLAHQSTLLAQKFTERELALTTFSIHAKPLVSHAHKHTIDYISNQTNQHTAQQQKVLTHLFNVLTSYEFSLFDTDGNKVMTQKEFREVINQIFKNAEDQKHYYANFDEVNGGKDVTLQQFQEKVVKKVQNPSQVYVPKEKKELIERRAGLFVINNKQNYALTYNFVFNIFDVNQDKVIGVVETHDAIALFVAKKEDMANVDQKINLVFGALSQQKVGDGKKITLAEWTSFAQQIQPQLAKALENATQTIYPFLSL